MTTEWQNRFARKIIFFQEGGDWHRDGRPPVRIAQNNSVVLTHILHVGSKLWPRLLVLVLLSLLQYSIIVSGIRLYQLNLK